VNSLPAIALATHLDIGYFLHAHRSLGGGWLAVGYSKRGEVGGKKNKWFNQKI